MEIEEEGMCDLDPYDIADPVDIFKRFNEKWCTKVLEQKWKLKKKMLVTFFEAAKVPKLANTNYHAIITMTKKLLKDANVNVVGFGLKILSVLSKGLRKNFKREAMNLTSVILQKLKEKKF